MIPDGRAAVLCKRPLAQLGQLDARCRQPGFVGHKAVLHQTKIAQSRERRAVLAEVSPSVGPAGQMTKILDRQAALDHRAIRQGDLSQPGGGPFHLLVSDNTAVHQAFASL